MQIIDERKDEVLEDYRCGASIYFLSRKYKCTRNTVTSRLKAWGVYELDKFRGPTT